MRADRIPMNSADEVDEFRKLPWWFITNGYGRDSGHRKTRKATKTAHNQRARRLAKLTNQKETT